MVRYSSDSKFQRGQKWLACARLIFVCMILILCASTDTRNVSAHGYLVRSIPQDQSTVTRASSQVQLWFSEPLEPKFSTIGVYDQNGQQVDQGGGVASQDHERITAKLPAKLADGVYIVRFRLAFASDGHVVADRILFWVGQRSGTISGSAASQTADPFEVLARALSMIGGMVATGTTMIYLIVLRSAWRNPIYSAGRVAPRIMNALYMCAEAAIGLALIGHIIWLLQQSTALFGVGLGTVVAQGLWNVTMTGTTFGGVWVLRVLFLIADAVSLYAAYWISTRRPGWVVPLWLVAAGTGTLCLLTFSLGAHAAGSTLWTPISVIVDWLHLLANAIWIGGLVALVWALRAAFLTLTGDAQRLALLAVLRRFSPLAAGCVIVTIATGAYSAFANVYTPDQVTDTSYGLTLGAKLILIVPLLVLGWLHNRTLRPERFQAAQHWVGRSLRIEAGLGVLVIVIAGLLSATPPPTPPTARAAATLPIYSASNGSLAAILTLNPGTIGANAYDIQLTQNGQPLDVSQVALTFVYPGYGLRADPIILDSVGNGEYSGAGEELDRAGNWQALIDVAEGKSKVPTRLALTLLANNQTDQAAVRTPTFLNWLSLAVIVVIVVIGVIVLVQERTRRRTFKPDPQFVLIGVSAAILMVIVLVGGELFLASASTSYTASANPTPLYLNPILPDQGSIDAGKRVFNTTCAACHNLDTTLTPTPDRSSGKAPQAAFSVGGYVTAHTDAGLYSFLLGSKAHPYGQDLIPADRWALLNYLRSVTGPGTLNYAPASPTRSP